GPYVGYCKPGKHERWPIAANQRDTISLLYTALPQHGRSPKRQIVHLRPCERHAVRNNGGPGTVASDLVLKPRTNGTHYYFFFTGVMPAMGINALPMVFFSISLEPPAISYAFASRR